MIISLSLTGAHPSMDQRNGSWIANGGEAQKEAVRCCAAEKGVMFKMSLEGGDE